MSLYQLLFDLQMNLCERFPNLTPFKIRRERAYDVFLLVRRLNEKNPGNSENNKRKEVKKVNGKTRVYVPVIS